MSMSRLMLSCTSDAHPRSCTRPVTLNFAGFLFRPVLLSCSGQRLPSKDFSGPCDRCRMCISEISPRLLSGMSTCNTSHVVSLGCWRVRVLGLSQLHAQSKDGQNLNQVRCPEDLISGCGRFNGTLRRIILQSAYASGLLMVRSC
jgi:hypothetical protein